MSRTVPPYSRTDYFEPLHAHGVEMETDETLDESLLPAENGSGPGGRRAGFVSGFIMGVLVGAGFALLFAPEEGQKTRRQLGKRMRSLQEEAKEGFDRASDRTRKELRRRQRRLKAELARVRAQARDRAREALE
jgi:gas vesicle protein